MNGELPAKIIIYRDGVGDGQLKQVVDSEITQLERSFERFGANYKLASSFYMNLFKINLSKFEF